MDRARYWTTCARRRSPAPCSRSAPSNTRDIMARSDHAHSDSSFLQQLQRDGVVTPAAVLRPLAGGVSSDIYLVQDGAKVFVVKRALEKLRVEQEWRASVSRNRYEQLYLEYVGQILPEHVPAILAKGDGYFAMEYLGEGFTTWKAKLLEGRACEEDCRIAGRTLATIHRHSAGDPAAAEQFDSTDNFVELRVEPYFLTIARVHPELEGLIGIEVDRLCAAREALVHGDYSPKNLMLGDDRFVIVDCEVAWYGDPAFDVAFLSTHLLLKALYHWPKGNDLSGLAGCFFDAYQVHRRLSPDQVQQLEQHAGLLLLLLLLARIDGKSPVEYLTESQQAFTARVLLGAIAERAGNASDGRSRLLASPLTHA